MEKTIPRSLKIIIITALWLAALIPYFGLYGFLSVADDGSLPGFEELENPKSNLASVIYSADAVELGKYYQENRPNVSYEQPYPWPLCS